MSLINYSFHSRSLGMDSPVNIILPEPFPASEEEDRREERQVPEVGFPTLYLFHGLSDDNTAWIRKTAIERYAEDKGLAVVMPDAAQSFYTNMACGPDYWTYVSKELPRFCQKYFPLSARREDNFAAGLSMGGYGAFKLALRKPGRFSAAASLSGALDIVGIFDEIEDPDERGKLEWIFGDLKEIQGGNRDLLQLVRDLESSSDPWPNLFQCCGTEDFLYGANLQFKGLLEGLSLELTYREEEGTGHEWRYWDRMIREVLEWLPL